MKNRRAGYRRDMKMTGGMNAKNAVNPDISGSMKPMIIEPGKRALPS
jgi:hypothetical protein